MKTKVEINDRKNETLFPCLMIADNGMIILATGYCDDTKLMEGTMLVKGELSNLPIGSHSTYWVPSCFKPLSIGSSITLTQE